MASFDVILDDDCRLVKIIANGIFLQADGEAAITKARLLAAERNYNVFYDMRNATTKVAFSDWYTMPRNLEVFKGNTTRQVKAAILTSIDDPALDDYRFYETVTANLGFRLRVFLEEAEAIEWTTTKTANPS